MANALRDVAIVGVAESDLGRVPDKSKFQLSAEASRAALDEAGLTVKDVDGLLTTIITEGGQFSTMLMAEYMGITPRFTDSTSIGGSSFVAYVEHAAMAIATGLCEVALICHGSTNISDRGGKGGPVSAATDVFGPTQFEEPYGVSTVGSYALAAQRHMHEYGTTSEQLAEIAVATRHWASMNPKKEYTTSTRQRPLRAGPAIHQPRSRYAPPGLRRLAIRNRMFPPDQVFVRWSHTDAYSVVLRNQVASADLQQDKI